MANIVLNLSIVFEANSIEDAKNISDEICHEINYLRNRFILAYTLGNLESNLPLLKEKDNKL